MTNDLAALSEAANHNTPQGHKAYEMFCAAAWNEYRAGRLVPVEQRDKAEALLCQRTNEYIEATARAEAAEARNKVLEEALRPFARIADHNNRLPKGASVGINIDRCRDARQALGGEHE